MVNIDKVISDIKQDITYFENIGFEILASKFKRDLETIQFLNTGENNERNNI